MPEAPRVIFSYHGRLRRIYGALLVLVVGALLLTLSVRLATGKADGLVRFVASLNGAELLVLLLALSVLGIAFFGVLKGFVRWWFNPGSEGARSILADTEAVYFSDTRLVSPEKVFWRDISLVTGGTYGQGSRLRVYRGDEVICAYYSGYIPIRVAEAAATTIRQTHERICRRLPWYEVDGPVKPRVSRGLGIPATATTIFRFPHFLLARNALLYSVVRTGVFVFLMFTPLPYFLVGSLFSGEWANTVLSAVMLAFFGLAVIYRIILDAAVSIVRGSGGVHTLDNCLLLQGTWFGLVDVLPKEWLCEATTVEGSKDGKRALVIVRSNCTNQILTHSPVMSRAAAEECAEAINAWLRS